MNIENKSNLAFLECISYLKVIIIMLESMSKGTKVHSKKMNIEVLSDVQVKIGDLIYNLNSIS